MVELLRNAGTVLIVGTAVLSWVVVGIHHRLMRWWATEFGRHVFVFELVLAVVLGLWALRLIVPEGDWFQFIRLIAFAGVPIVLVWRIRILIISWRSTREQREEAERGEA